MAAEEPVSRHEWLALAAILLLALVLRVIGLNAQLWYDEILTLTDFVRKPYGELVGDFSSLNNHMFYSLQARASILAFGESAWALRLPAMLYGVASLVVLWRMGREAAGRRAAKQVAASTAREVVRNEFGGTAVAAASMACTSTATGPRTVCTCFPSICPTPCTAAGRIWSMAA